MSFVVVSETELNRLDVEIGARVRARRKDQGLSQTQLGEGLGVSFQQVQKYERGTNRISSSSMIVIARLLKCSVADLIGEGPDVPKIDWSRFSDDWANAALDLFVTLTPAHRRAAVKVMRALAEAERETVQAEHDAGFVNVAEIRRRA